VTHRSRNIVVLALSLMTVMVVPVTDAGGSSPSGATNTVRVTSTLANSITDSMPFVRLTFSAKVKASALPNLVITPALSSTWQQVGPREFQAVATVALAPLATYTVKLPSAMTCAATCAFRAERPRDIASSADTTWEQQLLAQLHYLPATFTSTAPSANPSQQLSGVYAWDFKNLPSSLSSLWGVSNDNVIVRGALMAFQNNSNLTTTGVIDETTWNDLVLAVQRGKDDPDTYNYVTVSETSPEILRLYIAGRTAFHTLVNTGISVAPTPLGTFPVYLRYVVTTMSGFNPDGSHYSDPGIPWVSYFSGGSALHGFIRASYGWPQSLGCVEMPFASAQVIWPHTPIGTLVTVQTG
jgi:lipoprotein-anchoring transpeptidase ErfK/SrfK